MLYIVVRIRKLEETKRCICYTLDTLIRLHDLKRNPQGKCVGIFDLRGAPCMPPLWLLPSNCSCNT